MAEAVADAIRDKQHLIVEAGTGVGKSFAYLVPAILAVAQPSDAGDRRAAAARDHLHAHDQPARAIDPEGSAAAEQRHSAGVLGRAGQGAAQLPEPAAAAAWRRRGPRACFTARRSSTSCASLVDWSRETADGSLADLDFRPLANVWDEVESDSGNCMGRQCPTYEECFYYRARRRVQNAQILVVNHALFFSDLALRRERREHPARLRRRRSSTKPTRSKPWPATTWA